MHLVAERDDNYTVTVPTSPILSMRLLFFIVNLLFWKNAITAQGNHETIKIQKRNTPVCITEMQFIEYSRVTNTYRYIKKRAVPNLAEAIRSCALPYRYRVNLEDIACTMTLPRWMDDYSISFGHDHFFISFTRHDDSTANSIVLYYDIFNKQRDAFFKDLADGRLNCDSIRKKGKTLYLFKKRKSTFVGQVFLSNQIIVSYHTSDKKLEARLRTCVLSFKFEQD